MSKDFHHRRLIEFVDTDMAGIVHFSNYFRYMELAEYAFFRQLELEMMHHRDGGKLAWPRVHVECDYRKPLRFGDEVDIRLRISALREKAIHYHFEFRRVQDGQPGELVAEGRSIIVCAQVDEGGDIKGSRIIPDYIAEVLRKYVQPE